MSTDKQLVVLAGQPNCGKSTLFNALTGASQHVANYPGVTVDKMVGYYRENGYRVEVVDLPGIYSMTSYSPEERVSRQFILDESPSVAINIADASNLKRHLYLTFQLMEMEVPLILTLNMMDVAENRGIEIDADGLSEKLGVPVVPAAIKTGRGKKDITGKVAEFFNAAPQSSFMRIDYQEMESRLTEVISHLETDVHQLDRYPRRWLAIKLMESDADVEDLIRTLHPDGEAVLAVVEDLKNAFLDAVDVPPEVFIGNRRHQVADEVVRTVMRKTQEGKIPLSDRVDTLVCHKVLGPMILVGVIWLLYYLSIVQGYNITNYTWPILAKIRSVVEGFMPRAGFIEVPLLTALALWFVDSVNALLNYIPIFFILFGLIAFLEDCGYMPRMAFIMDRLLSRYGLHGQSTLPMVLGGIYVGGCAVPGVMSTKGIPDERSRLATILIIPLLNCLAKVPLYILLINIYFAAHKGMAMFFISTISLLMVLPVSRLLTLTVLKEMDTAPFVMEMPPYHMPTIRGVLGKAIERVWLFMRKITTIVAAVAVIIFVLLQFPGLNAEQKQHYLAEKEAAIAQFYKKIKKTPYADQVNDDNLISLIHFWEDYKKAKMSARTSEAKAVLNETFQTRDAVFFTIANPGKDKVAKKVNRAFKKMFKHRSRLLREMRKDRINSSFLGRFGQWLEPATKWAGFNWRVNVALLSAFAAKESSVATLGALYDQDLGDNETLEDRMAKGEADFTPLHALALMLFMVLYPPCLATAIAVKLQSGSLKWMLFSMGYPMLIGLVVAVLVFTGGSLLGLTGLQAMFVFYGMALTITILIGLIRPKEVHAAITP
ncbi:MAG: ferrous iron transport protein B [Deltaproteobacteria bacterium]|nr:MAG: ferrous iron transport protein B [Deltaproteobacteria bacterium]